jgi:hypothetical protein
MESKERLMSFGTSQATSRDWLAGSGNIRFSASNFVESMTISLAESQLGELSLEFRLWDDLSDEAIRKFEEIL